MLSLRSVWVLAILFLGSLARGQDIVSGPDKDKSVPALKVFDATGANKNKDIDYAAERKTKPTIYVFIDADKWDRPMARFLKELDKAMQKEGEDAYVVAVWLTDNVDKTKEYLPVAQQSVRFERTALTCHTGQKSGPEKWNINADAHLTAVIAAKGKVKSTYGYRSINETDAAAVMDAFKKAVKAK